jgi:hypothetical protein
LPRALSTPTLARPVLNHSKANLKSFHIVAFIAFALFGRFNSIWATPSVSVMTRVSNFMLLSFDGATER